MTMLNDLIHVGIALGLLWAASWAMGKMVHYICLIKYRNQGIHQKMTRE